MAKQKSSKQKELENELNSLKEAQKLRGDEFKLQKSINDLESGRNKLIKKYSESVAEILKFQLTRKEAIEEINNNLKENVEISKLKLEIAKEEHGEGSLQYKLQEKRLNLQRKSLETEKEMYKNASLFRQIIQSVRNEYAGVFEEVLNVYGYLMESDKAIKDLNKSLGVTGNQAERNRVAFEESATYVQSLGVSVQDLARLQSNIADITGQVNQLDANDLKLLSEVSEGTILGVEGTSEMVGNFMLIGQNAESTHSFVQQTMDMSERMGINAGKVLNTINRYFKEAQKYGFKKGVDGLADMAAYAEKFRVDMDGVFASAEKSKTLEGAIEQAAQLQVMGGKFANFDPMRMLYLSRNNMVEYTKEMNKMLKGISYYNQETKQFQETAADRDRLKFVAEATNQSLESLIEQSRRQSEIAMIREKMPPIASEEDRKFLETVAKIDPTTGNIMVKGITDDITTLTKEQIKQAQIQQKTLDERAKLSKTFDDEFKNTIMSLKSLALPLLRQINKGLTFIEEFMGSAKDDGIWASMFKNAGKVLALSTMAVLGKGIIGLLSPKVIGSLIGGGLKGIGSLIGGGLKGVGSLMGKIPGLGKIGKLGSLFGGVNKAVSQAPSPSKMTGFATGMKSIAGAAIAFVGVGAGVFLAAKGVSELVNSFKGMGDKQMDAAVETAQWLIGGMAALGMTLALTSPLLAKAGGALAIFGGAMALIGGSIYLGAQGISNLVDSMSAAKDINLGQQFIDMGKGLSAVAFSGVGLLAATPAFYALGDMFASMPDGNSFANMSNAFYNAEQFAKGNSDNIDKMISLVNLVNSTEIAKFDKLYQAIGDIKIKFEEKDVNLTVNVTSELDGREIAKKTSSQVLKLTSDTYEGKGNYS